MSTQPELQFEAPAPPPTRAQLAAAKAKARAEARLPALIAALHGKGWQNSTQLAPLGFTERELRQIVQHDHAGQILAYPGSPGYRLFDEATPEEREGIVALRNQSRLMIGRFIRYRRRQSLFTR